MLYKERRYFVTVFETNSFFIILVFNLRKRYFRDRKKFSGKNLK